MVLSNNVSWGIIMFGAMLLIFYLVSIMDLHIEFMENIDKAMNNENIIKYTSLKISNITADTGNDTISSSTVLIVKEYVKWHVNCKLCYR